MMKRRTARYGSPRQIRRETACVPPNGMPGRLPVEHGTVRQKREKNNALFGAVPGVPQACAQILYR